MLRFRLWGLEGASKNAHLGVFNVGSHLRVGELFVNNDSLNELRVFDATARFGHNLDQIEVHVTTLQIGNVQHGLDSQVGKVVLTFGHDLGTQGGFGAHAQSFVIVLMNVKLFLDLFDFVHSNFARFFKAVGNFERVDTLVEKFLGLLKDRACKHNHTSRTVTDLVVLGGGKFGQKTRGLMVNFHLLQYGSSIVSDDNLTVGTDEHFVHAFRSEGRLHETGNCASRHNINFVSFKSLDSLFLFLLSQDYERSSVFVERQTHD